jgi:DNA invertase Pin-like site-specific DNA recombinase
MTSADLLPATVLKRKAVVYVRQSTQAQVQSNLESQERRCGDRALAALVDAA